MSKAISLENLSRFKKNKDIIEKYNAETVYIPALRRGEFLSMNGTAYNTAKAVSSVPYELNDDILRIHFDFDDNKYELQVKGWNEDGVEIWRQINSYYEHIRNAGAYKNMKGNQTGHTNEIVKYIEFCIRTVDPNETISDQELEYIKEHVYFLKGKNLTYEESIFGNFTKTKFMNHNGTLNQVPQHTLSGLELSRQAGISFIELDVCMCGDGTLIDLHNGNDLSNETNGSGNALELTWDDIKDFYIPSTYNSDYADDKVYENGSLVGYKIQKVETILQKIAEYGLYALIDMKVNTFGNIHFSTNSPQVVQYCQNIIDLLHKYHLENQCLIICYRGTNNSYNMGMQLMDVFRELTEDFYVTCYPTPGSLSIDVIFDYQKQMICSYGKSFCELWLGSSQDVINYDFNDLLIWVRKIGKSGVEISCANIQANFNKELILGFEIIQTDVQSVLPKKDAFVLKLNTTFDIGAVAKDTQTQITDTDDIATITKIFTEYMPYNDDTEIYDFIQKALLKLQFTSSSYPNIYTYAKILNANPSGIGGTRIFCVTVGNNLFRNFYYIMFMYNGTNAYWRWFD